MIYAGAASKPPIEEIAEEFQKETGIKVDLIFGGSGYIMSQMKLSGKGDIYFPGSSDFMEIAKREKLIFPETEKKVVYLVNAINVQKGNPKKIYSLKDLCKPGIKVAIANPEGVCVGIYAVEIIEKNLSQKEKEQFKKNLVNYTESCDKTAAAIALKAVDAVIGWSVFQYWVPDLIESVPLSKEEIIRIGYIPIAVSVFTKDKKTALQFINYVLSPKGQSIFQKHHYFISIEECEKYIGQKKPIGGEYTLPYSWLHR
ncbi:MAG: molybdate ABC transporter substrate-binding protein [Bacteroidota bacterium]